VGIIPESLEGANLTENAAKITNIVLVSNKYLYYLLSADNFQKDMQDASIATTQAKLALYKIGDLIISISPLKEQQRIVDRIESLFEKLDKAKELIEEAREGFEKRKSAVLEKAFLGELTKNYRVKNNISYDWSLSKLKDITKIMSGGAPSRKRPEYFEGKIPWIKTGEIVWNDIYDSEEQIELIKKSILAKAFRGELGTNCDEDESALELMKKILSKE
jgi:restriction endonuclease S subunit